MKGDLSTHPLQSNEWAKFREKTGLQVINVNGIKITIHKIPHTKWTIGYAPKIKLPTEEIIQNLKAVGKRENCIFIQLEPNVEKDKEKEFLKYPNVYLSFHPLFTKYTFTLDLTKSEEELLRGMHPKTRYNIRVAKKHEVKILEDNSDKAFREYLKLTEETTKRQGFYAHTPTYHNLQWETLPHKVEKNKLGSYDILSSHLLLAKYKEETMAAWILFVYKDTLYYPYGASSTKHREAMASNLMMWEAILFGKKLGLKKFDMWGALGPNPNPNDPWYGFHRFKQGYGPKLIEFAGSYDLVINPFIYNLYKIVDKTRWLVLKLRR